MPAFFAGLVVLASLLALSREPAPRSEVHPVQPSDLAARVFALAGAMPTMRAEASPTAPAAFTGSADRGATLFAWKGCAVCHGPGALGNVGPRIAGTRLAFDAVLSQVRRPRSNYMPAFTTAQLAPQEVADIYAFLQSLSYP